MEKEFAVCVRASLTVTATNGLQSERETRRAFLVFKEMIATQQLEMTERCRHRGNLLYSQPYAPGSRRSQCAWTEGGVAHVVVGEIYNAADLHG